MAGFALRALGMVFRVFVAARLGPEGMGLYQLILSVYMVFVSLASAGINVASTRLGAQCLTRGRGMAQSCSDAFPKPEQRPGIGHRPIINTDIGESFRILFRIFVFI